MKKIVLISTLAILGWSNVANAQTNLNHYLMEITGTNNNQIRLNATVQTADGGTVVVTGYEYITLSLDGIGLVKFDSLGNKIWNKFFSNFGATTVHPERILELPDGSLAIGGNYGLNGHVAFILKTSAVGDFRFFQRYGGDFRGLTFDPSDNGFVLTGVGSNFTIGGNYAGYIAKTDSSGNVLWDMLVNYTVNNDYFYKAKRLSDGNYLAIGSAYTTPSAILGDGVVAKFNANGNLLWSKSYFNSNKSNTFLDFKEMPDKSLLIAGIETEFIGVTTIGGSMITKLDSSGNLLWAKTFSDSNRIVPAVVSFSNNAIYAAGKLEYQDSRIIPAVLKINETGQLLWTRIFKQSEQVFATDPIYGVGAIFSLSAKGKKLGFNSSVSAFTMDTSALNGSCYTHDTMLTTTVIVPAVSLITPLLADTTSTFPGTLTISQTSNIDFQKYDACNIASGTATLTSKTNDILIYPNPTYDLITIRTMSYANATYTITNMIGSTLLKGELTNEITPVNISELSTGLYFLNLYTNGKQTFKVVKQ